MLEPLAKGEAHIWRVELDKASRSVSQQPLRQVLARYLDLAPSRIAVGRDERGKPRLAKNGDHLQFNLSHSADLMLVAVARGTQVGVDVEKMKPRGNLLRLAERALEPAAAAEVLEAAPHQRIELFHRAWTQHEARLKCLGGGLLRRSADGVDVALEEVEVPATYVATVALAAPRIEAVLCRDLPADLVDG
ncbi:MAG: 4'-phosphopantetheinyl transferase family protein [Solirubrobacterales bacterium]